MIIEDLIRLGKPLIEGGMQPQEILELISDVNDDKVKNFFRHVFVVEIPPEDSKLDPVVLSMQVWGEEASVDKKGKKKDFIVDLKRALGAPFVLPAGGNPLHAQGRYGVPVYPCWDPHLKGFSKSADSVVQFLQSRIERTPDFKVTEILLGKIANAVHAEVVKLKINENEKLLGLLIIIKNGSTGAPFYYIDKHNGIEIGRSKLFSDKFIVPNYNEILKAIWQAKIEESKAVGARQGNCSFCHQSTEVVSTYCKAWPWALPEWNCPLPKAGKEELWVEQIALDESCCRALTLGAKVLAKTTRMVHPIITHELFSPSSDYEAKKIASKRKLSDLPTIYGTAYLLPIHDTELKDTESQAMFLSNVLSVIKPPPKVGSFLDRYIDAVTGFDLIVPENVEKEDYRLSLIYFHGDPGRGDIHLRAFIQDIIPSTLRRLDKLSKGTVNFAKELLNVVSENASEKQIGYLMTLYRSVPYLLARAYGGSNLWDQLERAVRRKPLDLERPIMNIARRIDSLTRRLPKSMFDINDEVIFYLTFLDFVKRYNEQILKTNQHLDDNNLAERRLFMMRSWKELIKAVAESPIETLQYNSPEEIGFGCGVLIRQFGRWYWNATKTGEKGKDYLKHRVLTFGSDLSPEVVWKRALGKMFDVAARYEKIKISDDFRRRVGVTLAELDRLQNDVRANRDAFMAAFWSGYALQGYNKKETEEIAEKIKNEKQ